MIVRWEDFECNDGRCREGKGGWEKNKKEGIGWEKYLKSVGKFLGLFN